MHEMAIAQALIELATDHARRAGAGSVSRLCCRIGVLRQVEPDLIQEAFGCASAGTSCEGAELSVERVPLRGRCPGCGRVKEVEGWNWNCRDCGVPVELLPGGEELELASIDAELVS